MGKAGGGGATILPDNDNKTLFLNFKTCLTRLIKFCTQLSFRTRKVDMSVFFKLREFFFQKSDGLFLVVYEELNVLLR